MGFVDINKLCCHYAIYWMADPENTYKCYFEEQRLTAYFDI